MSLPSYLTKIKSSGIYRYVFDKSEVPAQSAETLRLVVGYSEKGPFNTPVYIDNNQDFINLFGNINKRLEKKGVYFHRMALQALSGGPILALNIKPFTTPSSESDPNTVESVSWAAWNPWDQWPTETATDTTSGAIVESLKEGSVVGKIAVKNIYDTNRFWTLNEDNIPSKIKEYGNISYDKTNEKDRYINIIMTDAKDNSCTMFFRPYKPDSFNITVSDWYANMSDLEMPSYFEGHEDMKLCDLFAEVYLFKGKMTKELCDNGGSLSAYFDVIKDDSGKAHISLKSDYENGFKEKVDVLDALASDKNSRFIASYQGILIPYFKDGNNNYVSLDIVFNQDYNSHKMLMKLDDELTDDMLNNHFEQSYTETSFNPDKYYPAIHPIYIEGYDYNTIIKTSTAQEIQKKVFDEMMTKGIFIALTNRVDCEYHYIVDTFASYLEQDCKQTLSYIAKNKDNAFAILNSPAMSEFVKDKSFINTTTGIFDINKLKESNNKFSLPEEVYGASYCAFYTPLVFSDGVVKYVVPSAALVSNLFMEKWSSRQPYYIVAGPTYGRIVASGLVGPDYNYSREDLDVLEPMGINAIIYVPRKGTYINSNQTAKQVPVTALSKVHVRELVIYLQDEIESLLQNYQWELNTSTLRDTIKTKADSILDNIEQNGGVYAYNNVCDESNNTPEVIDNEMVILDTAIEPARGAGKLVQRLNIHRTGGLTSDVTLS